MEKRISEERERSSDGKLSYDRWADIYADTLRKMKAETHSGVKEDKHGNFKDFVEVRRPFIAPNNDAVSH